MVCRKLDTDPYRNARTIRHKINVLANEINNNSKNYRFLAYKELVTTIIMSIKDIIKLIEEELQKVLPTSSIAGIFKELKKNLELIVYDTGYFSGLRLDIVSIRQLTAEQLIKISQDYLDKLRVIGYIKEVK